MKLNHFLKNRTVRNAGWIIGGRLMNKLLAFLISILTARYLGPGNYGLIDYAATYTTFFASLCTLGINSVIIKDFVEHPGEEGKAIGTTLVLRAVSSFLSAVMIIGVVAVIDGDEPLTILVVAISSIGLLFQIFDTFNQWFQYRLQSKYAALASLVAYLAVSGYKLFLLMTGKSVVWFAFATSVDYVVLAAVLLAAYKKTDGPALSVSGIKAKQLLSASSSFILASLMASVYASTDKLMLKHLLDDAAVGYYGAAVSLSTTWAFLLQAVITSVHPTIIQSHGKDQQLFERRNRQLYAIVFYGASAISLVICLFAEPIVGLLYGTEYAGAVTPLQIVVWYTAFSYLGVARNAWMVCENRQGYLKYLYSGAAAANVLLNLLLIPRYGAAGAAAASLLTQIATTFVLPLMIRPLRANVRLMVDGICFKDIY